MGLKEIIFRDFIFRAGAYTEATEYILNSVRNPDCREVIVHINLRNYYYMINDKTIRSFLINECTLLFEGIGMKSGFWLKGKGWIPDLNGTDLFPMVMRGLSRTSSSVYFLGSGKESVKLSAEKINDSYPDVTVRGFRNGFFSREEEQDIVKNINALSPDILFIGMGFPKQEEFVMRHRGKINAGLIWCVGGLFDTLSGVKKRAPEFVIKLRLEWLYRLIKEPRRMIHRNTIAAYFALKDILIG